MRDDDDPEPSDEQLVVRARGPDPREAAIAFGQLIRRYERRALALAYARLGGDADTAGDVVQEAFLRAWQRLTELNEPQRFGAWLGRMVQNLAVDARRRLRRHERQPGARSPEKEADSAAAEPAAPGGSDALSEIDRDETRVRIERVLQQLDEQTREAVVLRYYENLSSRQIGELLNLSPAAVDMRLSRARAALRAHLAWADPATNGAP